MSNEDTDLTPPGGTSVIGLYLEGLGRRLGQLAGDVAEASRLARTLEGDDLEVFLIENERSARDVGDYAHDLARDLAQIIRALRKERTGG